MLDPGRLAQLVTWLTAEMFLTADPGIAILIQARSHTFMEIDYEFRNNCYGHSPSFGPLHFTTADLFIGHIWLGPTNKNTIEIFQPHVDCETATNYSAMLLVNGEFIIEFMQ